MTVRQMVLAWGLVIVIMAGCTKQISEPMLQGPATYEHALEFRTDGFRRSYRLHVPSGYASGQPVPLVVVLHGAFDTAEGIETVSGFSNLADREKFAVLYPNGIGILGFLQHWNAGHCCAKAVEKQIDDVGFIARAIEDVQSRLSIDAGRIYMVGFSNGGMMAYRFAAERGDLIAAVAPLAATIGGKASADTPEWRIPQPVAPVSVISIHGLADDDVRYAGGVSLHRGGERTYWPVEKSIQFWLDANGCPPKAATTQMNRQMVHLRWWGNCKNNTEIALYLIEKWGHVWPGGAFTSELGPDDPLKTFDAAELIWDFFKHHRRQ